MILKPEWVSSSCNNQRGQSHLFSGDSWCPGSRSQLIIEAKTDFLVAVKKAKTNRGHFIQEAKAACSKAICEAKAQKVSQAMTFHKEHGKYMQDLKEQGIGEESRSHNDFLFACQVILYTVHHHLKALWLPHITSYWGKHLCHLHSSCHRRLLPWKNNQPHPLLPHQCPHNLLGPKGYTPHQIPWRACLWVEPLQRLLLETPPAPRGERSLTGSKHSSPAMLRHLAKTLPW